jgi:hypothetical protein
MPITILARARETRTVFAAAPVASFVVARPVRAALFESFCSVARPTRIASGMIERTRIPLLPRLGLPAIRTAAKILARITFCRIGVAIATATAEKFSFPLEFPFALRPVTLARRPSSVWAIPSRPTTLLLKTVISRLVAPLLAAAVSRRIWFPVAGFPVVKTRSRTVISANTVRTIGAASLVVVGTRGIGVFTSRRKTFALPRVGLAGSRMGLLLKSSCSIRFAGIGAFFPLALAGKTALGEFLLRTPGRPGTALAGRGPIAPAAAIVVFVVIAGHEQAHFGYSLNWRSN